MTDNEFLAKILSLEYDDFSNRELEILSTYYYVFDLGKSFVKEYERYIKNNRDSAIKSRLIELVNKRIPKRFFVLNKLENYGIHENDCEIDFKARFFDNLDKMNNTRLCCLVDKMGKISKDLHISFFGQRRNEPIAYHAINSVVSQTFDLPLVFNIFGRNNLNKYKLINFKDIKRDLLVETIKKYCKIYFYLLEGISETLLEIPEEKLDEKKTSYAITKKLGIYKNIVEAEHRLISYKGKKEEESTPMMIDRIDYSDLEEDNEDYDY